jgi:hypothetical protein
MQVTVPVHAGAPEAQWLNSVQQPGVAQPQVLAGSKTAWQSARAVQLCASS